MTRRGSSPTHLSPYVASPPDMRKWWCIPFLLIEMWSLSESELLLWLGLIHIICQNWSCVTSECVSTASTSAGLEPCFWEPSGCAVRILSSMQRPCDRAHQQIASPELPAKSRHPLTVPWVIILHLPAQSGFWGLQSSLPEPEDHPNEVSQPR